VYKIKNNSFQNFWGVGPGWVAILEAFAFSILFVK